MYMPYLMYGYTAAIVLLLLGSGVAHRTVAGMRGMRLLQAAMLCGLLTVILMAARPWAPAWASILLANQMFYACTLLMYCSAADMLAVPMRFLPWGVALALVSALPHAWYTWVDPELTARILIASSICAVTAIVTARMLFRHRGRQMELLPRDSMLDGVQRSLGWLQTLMASLFTARCALTMLYPPADFVHMDLIQAGFTWLNLCLYAGNGCGLIWLALCIHRRELQAIAQTDGLTGLLNRRAFEEILTRELRRTQSGGPPLAVLLLDIDLFKEVNDTLGHLAGDEVIRRVSETLRRGMRPSDALARYGGEEFVALLRECPIDRAQEIAERMRQEIALMVSLPGNRTVTASLGVAASQQHDTPEDLLRRCDSALYGSKRGGRNLVTAHHSPSGSPDLSIQPA